MKALITKPIHQAGIDLLRAKCKDVTIISPNRTLDHKGLIQRLKGYDGVLCMLTDLIDRPVLDEAERVGVRGFANLAVGFDNFDLEYASNKGIMLTNTPGVLTDATAELAWALLFTSARRTVEADSFTRAKKFKGWEPSLFIGHGITGKTLGIIGAGRIGSAMARMSMGFKMNVLYHSPNRNAKLESDLDARRTSMRDLLRRSDFVSLHCPLTEKTRHMLGESEFRVMKSSAILINTARGQLVDEKALVQALKNKTLAAAGLDVYEREPEITASLMKLKNVVLLPHIGSATEDTRRRMAEMAAQNLIDMMMGRRPKNLLNSQPFK